MKLNHPPAQWSFQNKRHTLHGWKCGAGDVEAIFLMNFPMKATWGFDESSGWGMSVGTGGNFFIAYHIYIPFLSSTQSIFFVIATQRTWHRVPRLEPLVRRLGLWWEFLGDIKAKHIQMPPSTRWTTNVLCHGLVFTPSKGKAEEVVWGENSFITLEGFRTDELRDPCTNPSTILHVYGFVLSVRDLSQCPPVGALRPARRFVMNFIDLLYPEVGGCHRGIICFCRAMDGMFASARCFGWDFCRQHNSEKH